MKLLYCDETNLEKKDGTFFVYGGIAIDGINAKNLSHELMDIRKKAKIERDFILKFNPRPPNLSHEEFISVKKSYIQTAIKYDVKLLLNLILHNIATDTYEARRNAISTICYHFDCLLNRSNQTGIVLVDNFDDKKLRGHLAEKSSIGLTGCLPYSKTIKLKNIVGYHTSAIGQSHFCSLVEIIIGSMRYSLNVFTENNAENEKTADTILESLAPIFFYENGSNKISNISMWFSPKEIKKPEYREKYLLLKKRLAKSGILINQEI